MTYQQLWQPLTARYEPGEAKAIARLLLEEWHGLSMADILCGRTEALDERVLLKQQAWLMAGNPVQYLLGTAEFCGRRFQVDPSVLIPRPETEELCRWVIESWQAESAINVLDIGTGSGCIAVTLALSLAGSHVTGWDISPVALGVACENARLLGAKVNFLRRDALRLKALSDVGQWDLIVSNPPYVCESEAKDMEAHVLEHEPREALFVPDDDPLRFYRIIGNYAQAALKEGGMLFFETNPRYEDFVAEHLLGLGFDVEERDDQFGKPRFIKATRT